MTVVIAFTMVGVLGIAGLIVALFVKTNWRIVGLAVALASALTLFIVEVESDDEVKKELETKVVDLISNELNINSNDFIVIEESKTIYEVVTDEGAYLLEISKDYSKVKKVIKTK